MPDFIDVLSLRFSATFPQAVAGLVVVAVSWLVARFVGALVMRMQTTVADDHKELVGLLADVVGWCVFIVGIVAGLGTAGVNVTALVTGLGLTGFAIGFALKDILANMMAGVLILMFRPYARGDKVRLDKYQGTVMKVDLRYTTLSAPGATVLIPNAKAYTEIIVVLLGESGESDTEGAPALKVQAATPPQPKPRP